AESALSGIQRRITENDKLWYKRTFTWPAPSRDRGAARVPSPSSAGCAPDPAPRSPEGPAGRRSP
ncbi:hypothetical protein, partial [Streptomyces griseus]|uniref:hypothetical protein n=1 Tax=Streptomyces griseus TaxID=1911 RepID=UPI0033C208AA